MGRVAGGKITLYSYHGKYVSAQPNGTIEVNRDRALEWEYFEVLDGRAVQDPASLPHDGTINDKSSQSLCGGVATQKKPKKTEKNRKNQSQI